MFLELCAERREANQVSALSLNHSVTECLKSIQPSSKAHQLCHRKLVHKLDPQRLTDIVIEAVDIEKEFICEALPVDLIGMNKGLMSQYIDFCADRLLVALGQQKHYNTANPFEWMEQLSLQ